MGIRRLLSATLIVGLGLIFIKLTQSSNYEVVQAIEKIQETEFADREAVDFILEKFEEGDATASDFIVDYDNLTEFIEIRPSIVGELEALKIPHLDAHLARYYSSGSFGSQPDWAKSLELYLSGLEGCSTQLGALRWPLINGVDLIQLANLSEAELNRIHEKLQYCTNYDFLAAKELALFEWKLLGRNQKFLQFIDYERETSSEIFDERLDDLTESDIQRAEEIAATIKPEFGDKLYIYNTNERLGVTSLSSASQALAERANVESSSLYGALQWYPKQALEEIPSGSFEAEDHARQVLSESADYNGLAATYLHFLNHPEYGVRLSDEDYALSMLNMVQSDFGPGACYSNDRMYSLFPQYTDDELDAATTILCIKGYQHQLDLLERLVTIDYVHTDRDPNFSLYDYRPYFSLLPQLGESGPTVLAPSGMSAALVGLIFLYLAYLTATANQNASRNRAVSSILLCDGLMLVCCFGLLLLPTTLSLVPLANALIMPIPFIVLGLVIAQSYFISTFSNDFAKRFTKYHLGLIFVIGGIFIFLGDVFLYASYQPGLGPIRVPIILTSQPGFFFWSVSARTIALLSAELLLMHVCVFASVLFEHRSKRGDKNSETAYYLSAYFFRMLFLGISLGSLALGYTDEFIDLIISSYIFGELIYGLLFCYGIVKGNIFGVTQLIKRGIVKVLFTALLFTAFYFMETIVSGEFSDSLGNLAGFFGASLVLLLEKPINRYAYNFIDFLIPDNESLSEAEQSYFYLYKLALEDGVISHDEQKMLDFTARNLGLDSEDVLRIKNRINNIT